MASIFYEAQHGEVYQIDEVSQHLLVYVYLHGEAKLEDVVESIGAQNEHAVHSRVDELAAQVAGSRVVDVCARVS